MGNGSIVLRVNNNVTHIDGKLDSDVYKSLKKHLGYTPEDSYWMVESNKFKHVDGEGNYKKGQEWRQEWDGSVTTVCWNRAKCKCHIKKNGTHFPTGLLGRAREFLNNNNVGHTCVDERAKVDKCRDLSMSDEFELRDYQIDVVQKACAVDRGIIKASTGSGKTGIAASIIAERGVSPTIFYVPSIDLLTQAKNEIERFVRYNNIPVKVGQIGGGKKEFEDITVMTIQTAVRCLGGKYVKYDDEEKSKKEDLDIIEIRKDVVDLIKSSKLMIADEVQHWACETCQIISDASISCRYKWAMSATPWRDKGDDILIDACFGKCVAEISASMLIKRGYLVKPTINIINFNDFKINKSSYPNVYKYGITENESRNNLISSLATTYHGEGKNILILCKQINHGKILERMIPGSEFLHGSHSGKKRKEHLDKMRRGEARLTISSVIFDEGIDIRALDTLILAGSGKSQTRALQRIGRTLRPFKGKKHATIIDFRDQCKYLLSHSKKREKIYRTEPEFVIKLIK
jgi:superfamily II DNA or RNA helicase